MHLVTTVGASVAAINQDLVLPTPFTANGRYPASSVTFERRSPVP
jgi:hypothetical protein